MFLSKFNILNRNINLQDVLNLIIREWEEKYISIFDNICREYNIEDKISISSNNSDSELNRIGFKLLKEAIKCKAYIETELKGVEDIRAELEDCHMVREMSEALQAMEEERQRQKEHISKLTDANFQLQKEKETLEKNLQYDIHTQILPNDEQASRKFILSQKLENLRNRTQSFKSQNSDYCHIAPYLNVFSDSERSVSEEDSLEKDKKKHTTIVDDHNEIPINFNTGLLAASKSTPIKASNKKGSYKELNSESINVSKPEGNGNLTQDLKDIQTYLNNSNEEVYLNHTSIIDWDMSQPYIDESKEEKDNDDNLEAIEVSNKSEYTKPKFNSKLKQEYDDYKSLVFQITKLYDTVNKNINNQMTGPTCSGDQPDDEYILIDPVKQITFIQRVLENKGIYEEANVKSNKMEFIQEDLKIKKEVTQEQKEIDKDCLIIFKSLSEVCVRFLTEVINNLYNINMRITKSDAETIIIDNTSLVMDYLQYLISLKSIDFSNDETRHHPIYDLLKDFEKNIQNLLDNLSSNKKDKSGLSETLESFYQEELNKCYDDINKLKRQLNSSQQLLTNKMSVDTVEDQTFQWNLIDDFVSYMQDNLILFEAKQKLQEELDNVDREYSKQMIRERKRLEESETQYISLLNDYENLQKKSCEEVTSLKFSIDQLQRQHEDDKKFIDQQHFEWDLERSQHHIDIETLNKTICRIKRSFSCSDSISDSGESSIRSKLKKSNSLPKSSYQTTSHISDNEVSLLNSSTQTIDQNIIVLIKDVSIIDLEKQEEFNSLLKDLKERDDILLSVIYQFNNVIFDVFENEGLSIHLPHLLELSEKDFRILPRFRDQFWENIKSEIKKLEEVLLNFMKERRFIMVDYYRVQEELESSLTVITMKQGEICVFEEEIRSLTDFQKNLTNDYEVIQKMLEEKQVELDELSNNQLSANITADYEENIRKLKREIAEKQNIINERDEDLYVLKEEKENIDKELLYIEKQYDINLNKYKDKLEDLENHLKDYKNNNKELHDQVNDLMNQIDERKKEIIEKDNLHECLRNNIYDLKQENELMNQKITNVTDENSLSILRLVELEQQYKHNIEKLTKNLEDSERRNLQINYQENQRIYVSNSYCQTECVSNKVCNSDCLKRQEKLMINNENLKKGYKSEKAKCEEMEIKHRQFLAEYDALSNKVFSLETSIRNSKYLSADNEIMNESVDSFDHNTFLRASQVSLQSFEEDMEHSFPLKFNRENILKENLYQFRSVECQTVLELPIINMDSYLKNIDCDISISDWLEDLLKEVENVLQSCIIGDDISTEVLAKVSKFRHLLEQMYKRQLTTLLNKIFIFEKDLQIERKSNLELNNKASFLMTEIQESELVQKSLKNRLDQVLLESNQITESYKVLSDQARSTKIELTDQINKIKTELDSETYKYNDANRQLNYEKRLREQCEAALLVANERIQLIEESNSEFIKKSRQQVDYQQKEIDSLNSEYADMFRRYNENKLQLETFQQNLRLQTAETDNAKHELRQTIQSNTEYRTKMNEFIKMYQEKRMKLEVEAKELHQLLQISCRREITFIKENENLRMKLQSIQHFNKENEYKIKELERCISELHQRHDDDRLEWLKIINNGIIDKKKDDSILSQVNWLLRMLQLRIELLGLNYSPNINYDNLRNNGNAELLMLLSSIKSMQSMITMYLNNNNHENKSCGHSSDGKFEKSQNALSKRPKPTGSSDSLDSLSETESSGDPDTQINISQLVETKIHVLQMNKIVELQIELSRSEKWKSSLSFQKKFILSQIPSKIRNTIDKPLLTEQQKSCIRNNYFKFKFKAITVVIIAIQRLSNSFKSTSSFMKNNDNITNIPSNLQLSPVIKTKLKDTVQSNGKKTKFNNELILIGRHNNDGFNYTNCKHQSISNPVHSISPILEKEVKSTSYKGNHTFSKRGLSNSYPLRSSLKSKSNQHLASSLDRNILGRTVKLSNTIKQIDDFGKRLDKYTDNVSGCP